MYARLVKPRSQEACGTASRTHYNILAYAYATWKNIEIIALEDSKVWCVHKYVLTNTNLNTFISTITNFYKYQACERYPAGE